MLVLSREVGHSVVVMDVVVMLIGLGTNDAEISLRKQTGGKSRIVTLPRGQAVEVCYETRIGLVESRESHARLTIESPEGIQVRRLEDI